MTQEQVEQKLTELEEWLSLLTAQKFPGATSLADFKRCIEQQNRYRIRSAQQEQEQDQDK